MPNRILKESICTSDTIAQLNPEEEVFFYRLLVICDDYGRMDARPAILRARCFPLKIEGVTEEMITSWLKKLVDVGLVEIYIVNDKSYLHITTWEKHQQIRAKNSKYPSPDEGEKSNDIICNQMNSNDSICPRESRIDIRESIYEKEDILSAAETPDTPHQSQIPYQQILDSYHKNCTALPTVKLLTDKRKRAIKKCWDKICPKIGNGLSGIEIFETVFKKVQASDFLSGRNGKWTGCNFDWIINVNNMLKILEGTYDNKASPNHHEESFRDEAYRPMEEEF
jgi:hypothetical protein